MAFSDFESAIKDKFGVLDIISKVNILKRMFAVLVIVVLLSQLALFSLVYAVGPPDVAQTVFVHYAKPAKPSPPAKDNPDYKVFARWNLYELPVEYTINPSGSGMEVSFVTSTVGLAAEEWDDGTYSGWGGVSSELFVYAGSSDKTYDDLAWSSGKLDGENTIVFGNYPEADVIAVTLIWYTRGSKQIIEFDMVFDTDYAWGDALKSTTVMDLQNIATHELGHAVGLADLYRPTTTLETMYGYASYEEILKRDLYDGDIAGIKSLYD